MTRLPNHSIEPGASFRPPNVDDHGPSITPLIPRAKSLEIANTDGNGGTSRSSAFGDSYTRELPAEATIESELALDPIDPVSRINPSGTPAQLGEVARSAELTCLNGPTLAGNLLAFVTPRLRHCDVLRPEKHGPLLERLADALSNAPQDAASREGIAVLQLELRRLILLRQNNNGLIKG
ncbi:hypothetical protein MTX26_28215 [Bradyrhizobium sp. ISRA443]|uniref:hypothetical protein n=1 Tax=unclassified Bradyrhizobium TaxID=2631580 RepID=UPI00247A44FA|nr:MULTISPECIES: hypothetical protein [unclassified Bradyrhizobium]WGR93569.1 hypothetical protein MTX20_03090 [Bradyrhizobium sp. ISRA435]WGR98125.1 hypothetical protein MTX23_28205 [Bradyrhizobium sp. ISRA436]WGS05013.1 hypothetical protein MTX18_28220 [Bradyrhizobium sp. ISRA437]WGS11898.1 hypothetical protein MTX26_28215 [Bradyrhizobium sp. ISRA443]